MIRICLSAVFILLCQLSIAQNSIRGIVKDAENDMPLPGATIYIEGTDKGTVSDQNGAFLLNNLNQKKTTVRISFVGYSSKTISVALPQQEDLLIGLNGTTFTTEEFIVSGTRASETTPTTFQVIGKEVIGKDNLGQDLPLLLNYTPSIVTHSDPTWCGYFYQRGCYLWCQPQHSDRHQKRRCLRGNGQFLWLFQHKKAYHKSWNRIDQ